MMFKGKGERAAEPPWEDWWVGAPLLYLHTQPITSSFSKGSIHCTKPIFAVHFQNGQFWRIFLNEFIEKCICVLRKHICLKKKKIRQLYFFENVYFEGVFLAPQDVRDVSHCRNFGEWGYILMTLPMWIQKVRIVKEVNWSDKKLFNDKRKASHKTS